MGLDLVGVGSVAALAETIIERIWPKAADPTERAKAQLELQRMIEDREAVVIEAQKAIIVAEMQQADSFTKRARPSIVYAGLCFIFFNHVFLPCWAFFKGGAMPQVSLPTEFWWAWTGAVGIWMVGRTMEKKGGGGELLGKVTG